MNRRWLPVLPLVLVLAIACSSGGDGSAPEDTPEPTATSAPAGPTLPPVPTQASRPSPTPVATYDPGTSTGIDVIDDVLAALESGDGRSLAARLSFHPYRCDDAPPGVEGSNPCPPGVAVGSPVDVIAAGGCEVEFLARQSPGLDEAVGAFAGDASQQGLYAVVEVQQGRLASPLPLRYLVILSDGYTVLLDDAGVTHLGSPCDDVGAADLYHPADTDVLAPR